MRALELNGLAAAKGGSFAVGSVGETRERLVRRGTELLCEYSFDATGIEVLLRDVGVPKGSFYHYFSSKQAFAEAVIDNYAAYFAKKFE
jgi:TetR/AcrR family transcriptional repressor of nem operon